MFLEKNGFDLSLNYGKPSVIARVDAANKRLMAAQATNPPTAAMSAAESVQHACNQVMAAIDEIYAEVHGPGLCDRMFAGGDVDSNEVLDLYLEIVAGIGKSREEDMAKRLANAQEIKARRERIAAMQAEVDALEEENAAATEAETQELRAANAVQRSKVDTSVPYSDMSQRPRVPLAVPQAIAYPVPPDPNNG